MRLYRLLSRGLPDLAAKKCLHEARGQNDHVTKLWRRNYEDTSATIVEKG